MKYVIACFAMFVSAPCSADVSVLGDAGLGADAVHLSLGIVQNGRTVSASFTRKPGKVKVGRLEVGSLLPVGGHLSGLAEVGVSYDDAKRFGVSSTFGFVLKRDIWIGGVKVIGDMSNKVTLTPVVTTGIWW